VLRGATSDTARDGRGAGRSVLGVGPWTSPVSLGGPRIQPNPVPFDQRRDHPNERESATNEPVQRLDLH